MGVDGLERRSFYEHEAANAGWSVREMRRQIDSLLFERLLKAKDDASREDIILRTDKQGIDAHYALGGLKNRIFASTYTTIMPEEDELIEQVRLAATCAR